MKKDVENKNRKYKSKGIYVILRFIRKIYLYELKKETFYYTVGGLLDLGHIQKSKGPKNFFLCNLGLGYGQIRLSKESLDLIQKICF